MICWLRVDHCATGAMDGGAPIIFGGDSVRQASAIYGETDRCKSIPSTWQTSINGSVDIIGVRQAYAAATFCFPTWLLGVQGRRSPMPPMW